MLAPRTPARRLLAVTPAVAALLLTTGCQKPTPGITLVADGRSVHGEALAYCEGDKKLETGKECPGSRTTPLVLKVRNGDTVGIDVDKELSDSGWYVVDADARTRYSYQTTHYSTFVADFSSRPVPGIINLQVLQVKKVPASDQDVPTLVGQWKIVLQQES